MDSGRSQSAANSLVPTGIVGLDAMLYGGIPKGNQVILVGGPGSGKTLMGFEYLYRNAQRGDTGVFYTFEEDPAKIIQNAKSAFSNLTDIEDMIETGRIVVTGRDMNQGVFDKFDDSSFEFGRIVSEIEVSITSSKANRLVLDSSSALEIIIKDPTMYRRSMWALVANLRRLGVTSIFTSETSSPNRSSLTFKPEHFIFDGMLMMYQSGEEQRRITSMEIIKMRGYRHSFVTAPYDITTSGFKVFSPEAMTT